MGLSRQYSFPRIRTFVLYPAGPKRTFSTGAFQLPRYTMCKKRSCPTQSTPVVPVDAVHILLTGADSTSRLEGATPASALPSHYMPGYPAVLASPRSISSFKTISTTELSSKKCVGGWYARYW
jgi:hypothetical protein